MLGSTTFVDTDSFLADLESRRRLDEMEFVVVDKDDFLKVVLLFEQGILIIG